MRAKVTKKKPFGQKRMTKNENSHTFLINICEFAKCINYFGWQFQLIYEHFFLFPAHPPEAVGSDGEGACA